MSATVKTLYTLIPLSNTGAENLGRIEKISRVTGIIIMVSSGGGMVFWLARMLWCYDHISPSNPVYYGILASLISFTAIQAISMSFGVLFLVGALKHQQSFLFLWLISVFVLIALDTVVTVYSCALKDHSRELWTWWGKAEVLVYIFKVCINIPSVIVAIAMYRAIEDDKRCAADEREILL